MNDDDWNRGFSACEGPCAEIERLEMTEGERREYIAAVIEEATDDVVLFGVYPDEESEGGLCFIAIRGGAAIQNGAAPAEMDAVPCASEVEAIELAQAFGDGGHRVH